MQPLLLLNIFITMQQICAIFASPVILALIWEPGTRYTMKHTPH